MLMKVHRYAMGRRLNMRSEFNILEDIKKSKEAGVALSYLDILQQELLFSKFRNNPVGLQRSMILNELEPLVTYTIAEVQGDDFVDFSTKVLKSNFNDYVKRFEAEQGSIMDFIASGEKDERIQAMNEIIRGYNDEKVNEIRGTTPNNQPEPTESEETIIVE